MLTRSVMNVMIGSCPGYRNQVTKLTYANYHILPLFTQISVWRQRLRMIINIQGFALFSQSDEFKTVPGSNPGHTYIMYNIGLAFLQIPVFEYIIYLFFGSRDTLNAISIKFNWCHILNMWQSQINYNKYTINTHR